MEAARQDLQDITASKTESPRPRVELPSISGPELSAASSPLPGPRARDSQRTVRGKSENWLLDAMAGTDERTAEEEKLLILTGEKTETELQLEKRFRLPGDEIKQSSSAQGKKPADAEHNPTAQTVFENPLMAFMGDWISQRDHTLLLPKATTGPASNRPHVALPTASDYQNVGLPNVAGFSGEVTAVTSNAFSLTARPSGNPYLQILLPPMPASPAVSPEASAFGQPRNDLPSPSFRRQNDAPVPAGKPVMPVDLAKPDEDKKYFPQLKRF